MNTCARFLLLVLCGIAVFSGCRQTPDQPTAAARAAAITDLTINDIGRPIVVVAKTPIEAVHVGSPPPPGLITTKGDFTVYTGQLSQIVEGGIRIRAPFPQNPDAYKSVGIMAKDIQSIEFTD
jgi:hypothetical protein